MPEVRPIDANAIKKVQISMSARECCRKTANAVFLVMQHAVDEAPTLDYEPVVHAHWIENTDNYTPAKRCSHCGYNRPVLAGENIEQEPDDYCNKCGAKMDKKEN